MMAEAANVPSQPNPTLARGQVAERKRITRWAKGAWSGVIAGALFMTVEMFLTEAFGRGSIWDPVRLSASIALGDRAVATSTPFTFDIFFVGILVHFMLSIWYAVVLGMLIYKLRTAVAVLLGAGFGLLLYFVHFHALTSWYPWVASSRSWIVIVTHLVFGISAAWVYSHLHVRQLMHEAELLSDAN